jgi:orotate phosphoribosyltransferase
MIAFDSQKAANETARILLRTKSVLFNATDPFTYTSGRIGPVYVDCRRLISFTDERSSLMDMAAACARDVIGLDNIDVVAGGETAGIPYAAFIAERLKKPMIYVRKKPKGFGRMAQIEGKIDEKGTNILLVEDVQNFGASVKIFIDALRAADARIENLLVLFSHGHESSRKAMADMGVTLHALCDWRAVLNAARGEKSFDDQTLDSVESYLNDPDAWYAANAHKKKDAAQT